MEDFELTLFDRLAVMKQTIEKEGEENFYLSFSGGKDSAVLHRLLDEAVPENEIPRVFIDTGIEYRAVRDFALSLAKQDDRFVILKPKKAISKTLEEKGYPFKSKEHATKLGLFQSGSRAESVLKYAKGNGSFSCPKSLKYQFEKEDALPFKVSANCCLELKKKPAKAYERSSGRRVAILGVRQGEGGQRANHEGCVLLDAKGNLKKFKPLNPVSSEFEDWYIKSRGIRLCELYYPPYSFKRTGCKGCPFSPDLQEQLTAMEIYLPNERRQCETIWKKVYDEYRRIGFRLDKEEQLKLF